MELCVIVCLFLFALCPVATAGMTSRLAGRRMAQS